MTNQLPAHLQKYQSRAIGATALANLGASMPPHVSIGNNRFTLVDAANNEVPVPTFDPKIGPYLDAAIIDVADVMSRIFFDGPYDSTAEGKRPDCFSDNGVGPSMAASTPQGPTCAACPKSEWTKVNANGNKVPWCTQKYKIALVIPGFDTVFLLAVPPASHGPLREYMNTCKGNGAEPSNLVTRISFASQGVLQFHPVTWIDEVVAQLRERAYAEKKTDNLVGRNDMARPAIAAPVQQAAQLAPAHQTVQLAPAHQTVQLAPAQVGAFGAAPPNATGQAPLLTTQQGTTMQNHWPAAGQSTSGQTAWPQGSANPATAPTAQTTQWPPQNQQVQPPAPFGVSGAASQPTAQGSQPFNNGPAQNALTTSPSDPAPARRKRRTQADIAAANGATQQPAGAPQAPFPHPGQQGQQPGPFAQTVTAAAQTGTGAAFATQPGTSAANVQQLEFGIGQGQPAGINPDVQQALDGFFGGQG